MRRSQLARVSAKRRAEQNAYDTARTKAWLRDRGECQAAKVWADVECAGRREVHHVHPVGRFPEFRCDLDNLRTLCAAHHFHAHHVDPIKARKLGLLQ